MPAVALPAVGRAGLRLAGDLEALPAVVADAAAADVVDDDPVADREVPDPGADSDHLSGRLVAADHALIRLGSLAQVLAVDGAQVGAADGRRLHGEEDLTVAGGGVDDVVAQVDAAAAGKIRSSHGSLLDP